MPGEAFPGTMRWGHPMLWFRRRWVSDPYLYKRTLSGGKNMEFLKQIYRRVDGISFA